MNVDMPEGWHNSYRDSEYMENYDGGWSKVLYFLKEMAEALDRHVQSCECEIRDKELLERFKEWK